MTYLHYKTKKDAPYDPNNILPGNVYGYRISESCRFLDCAIAALDRQIHLPVKLRTIVDQLKRGEQIALTHNEGVVNEIIDNLYRLQDDIPDIAKPKTKADAAGYMICALTYFRDPQGPPYGPDVDSARAEYKALVQSIIEEHTHEA
jgi:hypothetical protein